ncbi:MAG: cytochrome b/b6 domain-containing protein, partial [Nitrospinota bacterium]
MRQKREGPSADAQPIPYSLLLRITHWLNVPLLAIMVMSGIQIWWAYPAFGPRLPNPEAAYNLLAGREAPVDPAAKAFSAEYRDLVGRLAGTAGLGGWLAGGLQWHFAFMWLYVINGLVFLIGIALTGEARHYRLSGRDFREAPLQLLRYLRLRRDEPPPGKFNPVQKLAYWSALLAGLLSVLTGLAIYKPVQLAWLTQLFGGYQPSRLWHFLAAVFLVAFTGAHLLMVAAHGWRRGLAPMLVGLKADRELFVRAQRSFGRKILLILVEAACLAAAWYGGRALGWLLNALFGGQAPAAFWAFPLYLILRSGLVRWWRAPRRGAPLRSVISP